MESRPPIPQNVTCKVISKLVQKPLLQVMSVLNVFFIANELANMRSLFFALRGPVTALNQRAPMAPVQQVVR